MTFLPAMAKLLWCRCAHTWCQARTSSLPCLVMHAKIAILSPGHSGRYLLRAAAAHTRSMQMALLLLELPVAG